MNFHFQVSCILKLMLQEFCVFIKYLNGFSFVLSGYYLYVVTWIALQDSINCDLMLVKAFLKGAIQFHKLFKSFKFPALHLFQDQASYSGKVIAHLLPMLFEVSFLKNLSKLTLLFYV